MNRPIGPSYDVLLGSLAQTSHASRPRQSVQAMVTEAGQKLISLRSPAGPWEITVEEARGIARALDDACDDADRFSP